ncbi:MAG: metallophosphoesterase family protein [Oscillospiraceae bacterium]|nr:metallophosphoesterase family protein [Oscillospiraceae bacterium]
MKLLLISDEEDPYLWDHYQPGRLDGVDLILSAGDLKAEYLSFLVTMAHCPLLYVHGNHDGLYEAAPPEGCECVDDRLVIAGGLRILGLGGCMWYNGGAYQYTEREMRRRARRLRGRIARAGGVDILLTHAPAFGVGDAEDPAHRGFRTFTSLLDELHPRCMVHGHVHERYCYGGRRVLEHGGVTVVNACGKYLLEL